MKYNKLLFTVLLIFSMLIGIASATDGTIYGDGTTNAASINTPVHDTEAGNYRPIVTLKNSLSQPTTIFIAGESITGFVRSGDTVQWPLNGFRFYWMKFISNKVPTMATSPTLQYQQDDWAYNNGTFSSTLSPFRAPSTPGTYYFVAEEVNTRGSEALNGILNTETKIITFNVSAPNPSMTISKSGTPNGYYEGTLITYTYTITNNGNIAISSPITIHDNKLGSITANIDSSSLLPGQSAVVTITHTATATDFTAGSITNNAYATGMGISQGSYIAGPITSNTASATVTASPAPDLSLTKIANPTTYTNVGDVITYTYNVTNTGNVLLNGPVTVNDDVLGTITLSTSNFAIGSSVQGTATHTVRPEDIATGSITNTATAEAIYAGAVSMSQPVSATVNINPVPALNITKTADPAIYTNVGDLITYTYNVTNTGNVPITGPITVNDDKLGTITISMVILQ